MDKSKVELGSPLGNTNLFVFLYYLTNSFHFNKSLTAFNEAEFS
jgi:hypothetical protein